MTVAKLICDVVGKGHESMKLFGRKQAAFSEPAAWWSSLDNREKLVFVLGFYSAMGERCQFLADMAETPPEVFAETSPAIVPTMFQAAANLCDYSGISPVDIVAHLTAFYADGENKRIPYAEALQHLRTKLAGEDNERVVEDLQKLRKRHPATD
jgi:hypothetical protein